MWPVQIERASIVISTEPTSAGPPEYPLFPMTIDEWQSWILKQQVTNWPRRYYWEPAYPLGMLHLLYVPVDGNQIALYLEQNLQALGTTGDSLLDFRPGFQYFIECNLAVRLAANDQERRSVSPFTASEAIRTLREIQANNSRPLMRISDAQSGTRWRSNVYVGNRYSW